MKTLLSILIAGAIPIVAASAETSVTPASHTLRASALLEPTKGHKVTGTVTFTEVAGGVRVEANLAGLTPGKHGFHIHEKGDCSAPDASSAGGHFNPAGKPHGAPGDTERHAGDMGNIEADSSGLAKLDYVDHIMSLAPGKNSITGHAVVVHAKPDDLHSQPSGDAGARVACGVIRQDKGVSKHVP